MAELTTAIFDLGGVVLRWDPRAAYADVAGPDDIERFMTEVAWPEWNRSLDGGRPLAEAEAELARRFPRWAHLASAYRENNHRAISGEVEGTAAVLAELRSAGVRLLALTNWSAETFAPTRARFPLLEVFEGIVVSGVERVLKPDPAIFRLLCERYAVTPAQAVFIDDLVANVDSARRFGLHGVLFRDAARLRAELAELGLL
ncbi:MAG TPA: HAD family phosphatase [Pseudonocardia sp.]|nr:HAD family phosphatase [Pseudonocardia sp.]